MRICCYCKKRKPDEDFYKANGRKSGRTSDCKVCHKELMNKRQDENKRKLVEYFGGKCICCGYSKNPRVLQFHHTDSLTKSFGISNRLSSSFETLLEEAKKCDMLCANCHSEKHLK